MLSTYHHYFLFIKKKKKALLVFVGQFQLYCLKIWCTQFWTIYFKTVEHLDSEGYCLDFMNDIYDDIAWIYINMAFA